jgi:hypothetical protein
LRDGKEKSRQRGLDNINQHGKLYDKEVPMSEKKVNFEERFKKYPYLRSRVESLLDIVEDKAGNLDKADEAEQLLIDEMRQMGKEALHDWAVGKEVEKVTELIHDKGGIKKHSKKKFHGIPPSER